MGQGWIKLHRKIRDCDLWNCEPFSRGQAWVDLLLMVNHDDKKVVLGSQVIDIKRGQTITSIRKLSEKWHWGNKKTLAFLGQLEELNMVHKESDTKKTLLTVINYDNYQLQGNTDDHTEDNTNDNTDDHTDNTQTRSKRNIKNKKEVSKASDYFSKNEVLQSAFKDFSEMRKKIKKPLTDKAVTVLINTLEKYSTDPYVQADMLDQSTFKGWQGVFPLKNDFVSVREKSKKEVPKYTESDTKEMTDEEWEQFVLSPEWENS